MTCPLETCPGEYAWNTALQDECRNCLGAARDGNTLILLSQREDMQEGDKELYENDGYYDEGIVCVIGDNSKIRNFQAETGIDGDGQPAMSYMLTSTTYEFRCIN